MYLELQKRCFNNSFHFKSIWPKVTFLYYYIDPQKSTEIWNEKNIQKYDILNRNLNSH